MRRFTEFAIVTLAVAAGTWLIAWWTVPLAGAAWGVARREDRWTPFLAGAAAATGWLALLFLPSSPAQVGLLAEVVGAAMGTGPTPLVTLTLLYPALLATAAASVARAVAPSRGTGVPPNPQSAASNART